MHHVMFTHSIRSDWNHGNAHFLRGLASAMAERGHTVDVHEPRDGWSAQNLRSFGGPSAVESYREAYPNLRPNLYPPGGPDDASLDAALTGADVVLVHEWTDPGLVRRIAAHHREADNYALYFHDTHHRAITRPKDLADLPWDDFTGVLAFGDALREAYIGHGWTDHAWTWHEAADPRLFRPHAAAAEEDLVWIGNWGDGERSNELEEFLIGPAQKLGLSGTIHGVRYPEAARARIEESGLSYVGWIPNIEVPRQFARHRFTVHVPRRPYLEALPGIPTIRMFEAFASGIPLAVARWRDTEGLFGKDQYLRADDGEAMQAAMRSILDAPDRAARMAKKARKNILDRHTCAHRLDELHAIQRTFGSAGNQRASIAFFGSSLLSSHWNGAATYYRGLLAALARLGHRIHFFEPDAFGRQQNRDMDPPDWAEVTVYDAQGTDALDRHLKQAASFDVVVKASGVGVHDAYLERRVLDLQDEDTSVGYWDVDAPATLTRMHGDSDGNSAQDPLASLVSRYDAVFTYGGGPRVVAEYEALGARTCIPVYNAVDPRVHHPAAAEDAWRCDVAFLANRLPDRDARVEEFFLRPARISPDRRFVLGGAGWQQDALPANVRHVGHVPSRDHNVLNSSARLVLNVNRDGMAAYGHSPATRIFEAAGAGACIVSDAWTGIEAFLEPGREILLAQDGDDVARIIEETSEEDARRIGAAARRRVLREHTYGNRALQVSTALAALPRRVLA